MKQAGLIAGIYFTALLFTGCAKDKDAKPTGLPGDNLDLYAVLHLFETSKSVEGFEKSLNEKSTGINNLDLNGDGKVDYIRVVDQRNGDAHAITLRVPVNADEEQDVAVIEIQKTGEKSASIQIVGDEDIYGKNFIVEPKDGSNKSAFIYTTEVGVNVWYWPSVAYVYSPDYVVWVSPYYYEYYPVYYDPWPPVAYEVYYPVVYPTHTYYVTYNKYRFREAHEIYYTNRVNSGFVMERHRNGDFKGGRQAPYKGNYAPRGNGNMGHGNDYMPRGNGGEQHGNMPPGVNPKGGGNHRGGNDNIAPRQGNGGQQHNNMPPGVNPKGSGNQRGGNISPKSGVPQGGGNQRSGGGNYSPKSNVPQGGNDHRGGGNISPKSGVPQGGGNQRQGGGNISPKSSAPAGGGNQRQGGGNVSPRPQGGGHQGGGHQQPRGSVRPR